MKKNTKNELWRMRAARNDKENISKLAKRLKVKESEAVRRAVCYMLQTVERPNVGNQPQLT